MVQPGSDYCAACNSFFHTPGTCPKTLPPTYQPVSNVLIGPAANTSMSDGLALELHHRSIFAHGIGHEGRRCDKHHKMHSQMLGNTPKDRSARVPIVLDYFDDSCVVRRSLLPICSTCVHVETGIEPTVLASGLDMCRCATMLARATCPDCVLGEINGALNYDVLKRSEPSTDDFCKVACRCGNKIRAHEAARQCVYCRGIVTAPLHSMGMVVRFWSLRVVLWLRKGRAKEKVSRRMPSEHTARG